MKQTKNRLTNLELALREMPRKSSTVNDEDMFPEIEPMELSDAPATSKKRKRSATKDRNATEDTSDVDVEGVSGDENGQEEQEEQEEGEEQEEEDEEEEEEEDEAERQRKTKKARRAERAGKKRKHREVEEQENDEDAVGEGDAGEDMMVQGVTQEMRDMMVRAYVLCYFHVFAVCLCVCVCVFCLCGVCVYVCVVCED